MRRPSVRSGVHRDLRFDQRSHQTGRDVKAIQRAINARAKDRGIRPFLKVDGDCGRQTIAKGRQVALALGCTLAKPGLSKGVQDIIRNPATRTKEQLARAEKYVPPVPHEQPHVKGNTVVGGDPAERIVAAWLQAAHLYYSGESHRFYSQPGRWTVDRAITGESHGERSDCSQCLTGIFHAAGVPDPNGQGYGGGFTGTLVAHGEEIRREDLEPGRSFIIYGPGVGHHVEGYVGDGKHKWRDAPASLRDRTVGHGSPPVDFGDIDMIAGARYFRARSLT